MWSSFAEIFAAATALHPLSWMGAAGAALYLAVDVDGCWVCDGADVAGLCADSRVG